MMISGIKLLSVKTENQRIVYIHIQVYISINLNMIFLANTFCRMEKILLINYLPYIMRNMQSKTISLLHAVEKLVCRAYAAIIRKNQHKEEQA